MNLAEDIDPNRVDVPDELAALLAEAPSVTDYWETLTHSRRMTTLSYPITFVYYTTDPPADTHPARSLYSDKRLANEENEDDRGSH